MADGVDVVADPESDASADRGPDATVPAAHPGTVATTIAGAESVVVASMGEHDELGVEAGLRAGADCVGLVASGRRRDDLAATVAEHLQDEADGTVGSDGPTTPAGPSTPARSRQR